MDYAKRRREEETTARDDLKNLIPAEHFHADVEGDGNYNLSTKVMKAAEYYIQAQEQEGVDVGEQAEGEKGKGKAKSMVVKLRYGKGKRKAIADVLEEEGEEYDELARGVQVGNEERTASGDARHRDMVSHSLLDCLTYGPSPFPSPFPHYRQSN